MGLANPDDLSQEELRAEVARLREITALKDARIATLERERASLYRYIDALHAQVGRAPTFGATTGL